ncbi:MAG: outer membrane lipoprotein-sorting protein [Nitrospirota bacterium]
MNKYLIRSVKGSLTVIVVFIAIFFSSNLFAANPENNKLSADEIIKRSENIYPGRDQKSKLTFLIKEPNGDQRKMVLYRFWLSGYNKGNGDIISKTMIFNEYPPESRGTSFMVWSYNPKIGREDEQWIYLPILRKVNKIPGREDKSFQGSDVNTVDMIPRPVDLDTHKLIGEDTIGDKKYYIIESIPRSQETNYNYGKVIKRISKDQFLKEMIEYYNTEGKLVKQQTIKWKKLKDAWVFEKVVIKNLETSVDTILNISDIEIDIGLNDKVFTERTLRLGLNSLNKMLTR